jgi:hypothetical protein
LRRLLQCSAALLAAFIAAQVASAGTVRGTVNNATTGKPGAGVEVVLIQLQGGMTPVANTKSDASGQFSFDDPGIGARPMLVRAIYKGVNFHQPLPPGKDSVSVDVFEPTSDPKTISVPSRVVIFQPNGANLIVGEEYGVKNDSAPPQAYFRADGNFEVSLPENADLKQIAASGPSGMPVVQAPIDRGKGRYAIAFAFRPGESDVRLSYQLPYPGDTATVKIPTTYGGGRLLLVAPPTVKLTGDGLQMAGQEQGMNIYERGTVTAGTVLTVAVSGTAPPPSQSAGAPGRAENVQGGEAAGTIQAIPGRLDALKWPLVAGFCILFVLAAIILARKPVAVVVPQEPQAAAPVSGQTATSPDKKQSTASPNGDALASLDHATANSLDALKDHLFRLELRHQAGTISEEEYSRERAKAEQVLRDLVRG